MEPKLIKTIYVYRGLLKEEVSLVTNSYSSDILSEHYSRTLKSSKMNSKPSIRCASEDPRVACEYSQKPEYSGKIAKIEVSIWSDGSTTIKGMPEAAVHRMWQMSDWIDLSAIAGGKLLVKNLNYHTSDVLLNNIISFGGQSTARSYALQNKMWGIHSEESYEYQYILTEEEIDDIPNIKRFNLPSNGCIHYNNPNIISICNSLIEEFELYLKHNSRAWVRYTIEELQNTKANVLSKIS